MVFFSFTVWYEPTDVHKAHKVFDDTVDHLALTHLSPNIKELDVILRRLKLQYEIDEITGGLFD